MKFWKRIFIYSMTLFLIIFNSAGIFIIENIHKRSIDRTIKVALDEHKNVEGILDLNSDSFVDTTKIIYSNDKSNLSSVDNDKNAIEKQLQDWISLVVPSYVFNDKIEPNFIEIYDNNNKLFFSNSGLQIKTSRPEIIESKLNERTFIIRKVQNKYYLFISSKFKIKENPLNLILIKNINLVYEERLQNYKLFLILDGCISLILAIGMYFISKKVTKPIVKLSDVSKEITQGNYAKRAEVKNSKDEIGILAKNFNTMIQATEDTIEELKNLNNAKQVFIDSLTHELKTPLTSIIGYSDLLLKGNITEEIKYTALNYINSEAKRVEKLSLTLLKLILVKQEDLNFNIISLKECVYTACKTLSYKIETKEIVLKLNIEDCTIRGDKDLIIVLIINLLDNAIKASTVSGIIDIECGVSMECGQYILILKDYGVGIPKEDLSSIKEPFYMVDKARDRANSGVGLGLAICDEICNVHNINFDITSVVNEGTVVVLKFNKENSIE